MFLKTVEAELVDLLSTALEGEGVRVVAWPDRPLDFGRAQMKDGLYVRFAGLDLELPTGNFGHLRQDGKIRFEARLLVKDLRSHTGAYELIEKCQAWLTGFCPGPASYSQGYSFGVQGLALVRAELIERVDESGQWDWGLMLEAKVLFERQLGGPPVVLPIQN